MAIPPQLTDAGEPGEAPETSRPLAFANSIPFMIGVWLCAAFPLGAPIWFALQQVLGGVGWIKNVGAADRIFYALGILLVACVWTLFALFFARVTRDWAARRRYFQR